MSSRFILFFLFISTVITLSTLYLSSRLVQKFNWPKKNKKLIRIGAAVFISFQVVGPAVYRIFPDSMNQLFIFQWITYISLGAFACTLAYIATADFFSFSIKKFTGKTDVNFERRSFLTAGALSLGTVVIGGAQAAIGPKVYEVEIPLKNLPDEFVGFRIVQISDLHVGPLIGREYTEKVAKIANQLKPDLVALTGDFIDGSVSQLREKLFPLTTIKSPYGSYFITGNHEYYWGVHEWTEEFRKMGADVLLNEHRLIKKGTAQIVLAGVTDMAAEHIDPIHMSDPKKSLVGAPENSVKILLAHQPASHKAAAEAGFDLQLSGHTHGGQFFPWNILVKLAQKYYKGLNRHENMWIYVNRGTGYWGPPLRFAVPAEITLIKLAKA